jgi:hypothetical protein
MWRQPGRNSGFWLPALAIACVLLLACVSTVQVAHSHADAKAGHCQICFNIHSAMPAAGPEAPATTSISQDAQVAAPRSMAPRFWNSPLANGPPSSPLV